MLYQKKINIYIYTHNCKQQTVTHVHKVKRALETNLQNQGKKATFLASSGRFSSLILLSSLIESAAWVFVKGALKKPYN